MEELKFNVDSALLNELGERLVESVHIALIELVKNSYDADATDVHISFSETDSDDFQVAIKDNGCGMTFDDVKRYWMRIATTNKVEDSISPIFGRPKSGSKGIGRFSCRRLGDKLELLTTSKLVSGKRAGYEQTKVVFEWTRFTPGTEVTNISCPGERRRLKNAETGTTLIITGGDKWEWGLRQYNVLKRQLSVLVANRGIKRDGYKEDPGFSIILEAPNFTEKPRDLREDLINAGWGTIEARITSKGYTKCELDAKDLGKKKIIGEKKYKYLSGVSLKIGILVADPTQIRDKSILSKATMSEILNDWGGVQVKYKGVRIYPYGDDDWLKIDADRGRRLGAVQNNELQSFAKSLEGVDPKRALLSLLSHRSYLGTVQIDSKHKGFQPKVNREGFMETPAVKELREFVRYAIDWATIYRDYWIRQDKKIAADKARKEFERSSQIETTRADVIKTAAINIKNQVARIISTPTEKGRKEAADSIVPAINAILAQNQETELELNHLRLIASSSTLLLIFSHEVKSFLSDIDNIQGIVERISISTTGMLDSDLSTLKVHLSESKSRFEQLLEMTALVGVDARKHKPVRMALYDRVKRAVSCFALVINNYGIAVEFNNIPINLMIGPIFEAELYAILMNILSNSIKSVIAAGKTKKINISANRENNKTKIMISDTGIGLDKSKYEDVFTPFIADPEGRLYSKLNGNLNPADKYIVGTGSGIGLSIIKEIIESCEGSIRFVKPIIPWKAQLEVILP